MPKVAPEDTSTISHINYVTDSIHDFGDSLYDDAQKLIKVLADLIQSLSDEI